MSQPTPRALLVRARELFNSPTSGVGGKAWAALEAAADELRTAIDDAEEKAEECLDLPSWTGIIPNWDDAIAIAERD